MKQKKKLAFSFAKPKKRRKAHASLLRRVLLYSTYSKLKKRKEKKRKEELPAEGLSEKQL